MPHMPTYGPRPRVGFIGLGRMGGAMARRLIRAGYRVTCYDRSQERLQACVAAGGVAADGVGDAVRAGDWVLTSLPSSAVWVDVAERVLAPLARPGQIFMDMGTTELAPTRRLADTLAERGACLLDTPVSGGEQGAQAGTLRIFVGGDPDKADESRPILEVLGDAERIVYCGPSGSGQIVKAVNQLAMGLVDAAVLESIALGAHGGVEVAALRQAVGGDEGSRARS